MSESILVGVDDTPQARAALDWSLTRAAATGARVLLVHVVEARTGWAGTATNQRHEAEALELLQQESDHARASWPAVEITPELRFGSVVQELVKASEGIDLSVVGTHTTRIVDGNIIGSGSVAFGATARSTAAVIPVRPRVPTSGIIVGVDNSPAGLAAVRFSAREADHSGENLTLLRAFSARNATGEFEVGLNEELLWAETIANRMLAEAEDAAARECPGVRVRAIAVSGATPQVLLRASARATMLVMGGAERRDWGTKSMGQNVHDVITNVVAPTIIVRERK